MQVPPPAHTPNPQHARSPPPAAPLAPHLEPIAHSLLTRLDDIEHYQVPQLATCQGPLSFHNQLAASLRAELAGCRRDTEELKLEVDDLERARDRAAAAEHVRSIQRRIDSCTKLYRQAVLASKRQIDAYGHLAARDELLAPGSGASGRGSPSPYSTAGGTSRARSPQGNQSADDALMSATSDVTEGLRRTLQLMQQEVDRSLVSNELLESQTKTMEMTSEQYSTLSSLLHTSRAIITSLERSAILDRLVLFGAFAFFAAVCAHIFKKRVIDRGVHVLGAVGRAAGAVAGAGAGRSSKGVEAVGGAVKEEAKGELARATAAAGALAGAAWRGVEALRGRAFPRAEDERGEDERGEAVPADGIVPQRDDAEGARAEPVHASVPAPANEEESAEPEDVYFDAPEPTASAPPAPPPEPIPTVPAASFVDEAHVASSAAPLPAASTVASPPGVAHEEVPDAVSAGEEALPPQLERESERDAEREAVALRGVRPPVPSRDAVEEVKFTPRGEEAEAAAAQIGIEEHEHEQEAPVRDKQPAGAERLSDDAEGDRILRPLDRIRPTRPDLDAQLGDMQRIVDAHATVGALDANADADAAAAFDPAGQSITAPASSAMPFHQQEEADDPAQVQVRIPLYDPALDARTPVGAVAAAGEAARVAEAHAGAEGTRVPEGEELREGGLPRFALEGTGAGDGAEAEAEVLEPVRLPVDLEAEQTLWGREEQEVAADRAPPAEEEAPAPPMEADNTQLLQDDDEALLDELLEAQLGAAEYAGMQRGIGGVVPNATAVAADEPASSEAELDVGPPNEHRVEVEYPAPIEQEDAITTEEPLVTPTHAAADHATPPPTSLDTISSLDDLPTTTAAAAAAEDIPTAAPAEEPASASTAATTFEQEPSTATAPSPGATVEPHISAAPAARMLAFEDDARAAEGEEAPPSAEAEEAVEPEQAASTGAPVGKHEYAEAHSAADEGGDGELLRQDGAELDEPLQAGAGAETDESLDAEVQSLHNGSADVDEKAARPAPVQPDEGKHAHVKVDASGSQRGAEEDGVDGEYAHHQYEAEEQAASAPGGEAETVCDEEHSSGAPSAAGDSAALDSSDNDVARDAEADALEDAGEQVDATADVANSDIVYPDPSVEEEPLTSVIDDVKEDGVFESAAVEAIADHVGEHAPAPGQAADEALHRAEDILDELEQGDDGFEYEYDGEAFQREAYEGEEEGEPYYEEEEAPAPRDEL